MLWKLCLSKKKSSTALPARYCLRALGDVRFYHSGCSLCYAMSGTDSADTASRPSTASKSTSSPSTWCSATCLRARYAMPGTDIPTGATRVSSIVVPVAPPNRPTLSFDDARD
eukprot:3281027-Rhodomonas_salina.3